MGEKFNGSIEDVVKVLALLPPQGNYTYADKMSCTPLKDSFTYYLCESLKGFYSFLSAELKEEINRDSYDSVNISEEMICFIYDGIITYSTLKNFLYYSNIEY